MVKNKKTGKTAAELSMRCAMKPYSMFEFIRAIRERALLWDHNDENFHNRLEREKMWYDIAKELISNFEDSKTSDKLTIVKTLQKRWKNSRDSYLRAQRLKQTNGEERSYIYEKEMSFLIHCSKDENDVKKPSVSESNFDSSDESRSANSPSPSRKVEPPKRRNATTASNEKSKKRKHNKTTGGGGGCSKPTTRTAASQKKRHISLDSNFSFDAEMEVACQVIKEQLQEAVDNSSSSDIKGEGRQPQRVEPEKHNKNSTNNNSNVQQKKSAVVGSSITGEPDPDQAFFDSIKPNIRKMSADQKLDFQIEILKLLKNFSSK